MCVSVVCALRQRRHKRRIAFAFIIPYYYHLMITDYFVHVTIIYRILRRTRMHNYSNITNAHNIYIYLCIPFTATEQPENSQRCQWSWWIGELITKKNLIQFAKSMSRTQNTLIWTRRKISIVLSVYREIRSIKIKKKTSSKHENSKCIFCQLQYKKFAHLLIFFYRYFCAYVIYII